MRVMVVVGARPNFMKAAPIVAEMASRPGVFEPVLVHTGQHYDDRMSGSFLRDLELPIPDVDLGVGSGTHAEQTARVMTALEPTLRRHEPQWLLVVGDVNSTLAAALTASKLGIRIAHVEAGLRSFDRTMPEEINRILTDQIADLLFTTEESANRNLRNEGIGEDRIHFVGNVMIDSLIRHLPRARNSAVLQELGLFPRDYAVVTLHRPSNVDDSRVLTRILDALEEIALRLPIVFPVHPRTHERMNRLCGSPDASRIRLTPPLSYLDFLKLFSEARLVFTDSGGMQEEATFLRIPCLTLRPNTERPVTIELGTNRLVDPSRDSITEAAAAALLEDPRPRPTPPLWDGKAAERIVTVFRSAARL